MSDRDRTQRLTAIEWGHPDLEVTFYLPKGGESRYQPERIRIGPRGMFLHWPEAPREIRNLQIEWAKTPFQWATFRCEGTVTRRLPEGIEVEFNGAAPAALRAWFVQAATMLENREPNAALRTSQLYTLATVVSAFGLFCGAIAILLPILVGDRWAVDQVSKLLLVLMVVSIGGFAWIRILAGRQEIKALKQGRG